VLLGTATTNSAGDFSLVVTIPADTAPGQYKKVATGPSAADPPTVTLSDNLTVLNCPPAAAEPPLAQAEPPTSLPKTGFDTRIWLVASLAFILIGSALVLGARKRRHRRAV
jgi:LPXTG-motif cell wall-anchored protein